ncbi:MAG: DUF1292 domain-containing protein [Clostridiales bacterium]|nr:DUF1292 domain-containing protein [Clostridiales bacterium]
MEDQSNIIELVDEDGKILSFEYLMTLDYGENEYVILVPMAPYDDSEDDLTGDEVVILKVEQDENGDDVYISIEDEKELDEVFDAFSEIIAQDENEDS